MKKSEIKVGGLYVAKVSGNLAKAIGNLMTVRVDAIREVRNSIRIHGGYRQSTGTVYDCTTLHTGCKVTFRNAQKFHSEVLRSKRKDKK